MKKILLGYFFIFILIIIFFSFTNCDDIPDKVNAIDTEVDYTLVSLDKNGYYFGNTRYEFIDVAKKITKKNPLTYRQETFLVKIEDNVIYYEYIYGHAFDKQYDCYLLKLDILTNKCDILYYIKNTKCIYLSDNRYASWCYFKPINDNLFSIQYNGMIKIIDIDNQSEIFSIDNVYEENAYLNKIKQKSNVINNCDYYCRDNDMIYYYLYQDKSYVVKEFEIDANVKHFDVYDGYFYTYNYHYGENANVDCYDIYTGEKKSDEFLENLRNKKASDITNQREEKISNTFTINNRSFTYNDYIYDSELDRIEESGIEIFENSISYFVIDENYMLEKSTVYNKLVESYSSSYYFYIDKVVFKDNKLFIAIHGEGPGLMWGKSLTPTFLFELDIDSRNIYYAGYADDEFSDIFIV